MVNLIRYGRTLSHLRPSQVTWRMRYLVQRKFEAWPWLPSTVRTRLFPKTAGAATVQTELPRLPEWEPLSVEQAARRLAELQSNRLTLLNLTRDFAGGDDWCMNGGRNSHRLWTYNLHYHRWLYELGWAAAMTHNPAYRRELWKWLTDWLDVCRPQSPGFTHFPWNSFTIATRLQWWQRLWSVLPPERWDDPALAARAIESFVEQAQFLASHVEWDLRGNHLLRDASGLAIAAHTVRHRDGRRWLRLARKIAAAQIDEQILPDGVHFERSVMYHVHVLEDLLTLQQLVNDAELEAKLRDVCVKMAEALAWLRHPDGTFPLFNDAAEHAVCEPGLMLRLVDERFRVPPCNLRGMRHFSQAGIVAWHGMPWTVFWDVGEVGPDYQPGHAHADTLTLECSYRDRRLVVDPGTYCYDLDERRNYDRSTAAHNTVCIDDGDSSEVWHIFRVGARARPLGIDLISRRTGCSGWAAHTGYDALPGSPRHSRHVVVDNHGPLKVVDHVSGQGRHRIAGGFLIAPDWNAEVVDGGWRLTCGALAVEVRTKASQPVERSVQRRPWHPEYGLEIDTARLTWCCETELPFEMQILFDPA